MKKQFVYSSWLIAHGLKVVVFLCAIYYALFTISPVHAITCDDSRPSDQQQLEEYIADCQAKKDQSSGQAKTLSQALSILNIQIKLTEAKIAANVTQLDKLGVEITDLSSRISSIDYSLTDLTKLFIKRVKETYMYRSTFDAMIIAQTSGIGDAVRVIEYTKKVRDHDRNILITLEKSRLDFDTQKQAKEQKQQEIEALKKKLNADKAALAVQVSSKNQLLAQTKNDEDKYQQLLATANRQLQQFKNYTTSQGGSALLPNQTKCNDGWSGCYYSQRDTEWGNINLGGTGYTMKDSGCFVTSVAMMASHVGKNIKPSDIAVLPAIFTSQGELKWQPFNVDGTSISITSASKSSLDSIISSRPVIAELNGGAHFIVILRKEGDTYIVNDPYLENGYNKPLSASGHVSSDITGLRLVNFN